MMGRTPRTRICILLSAGLLTACAVGPDYERPDTNNPDTFRSAANAPSATTGSDFKLAGDAWWEGFNDPVLNELVEAGLQNNRDLQSAIARVRKARGQLITTRGKFFPQVEYYGAAERGKFLGLDQTVVTSTPGSLTTIGTMALPASWQLDVFGGLRRQYEAASANQAAAEASRQAIALSVAGEVANIYITLRSLDQQLAVAKQTLENYKTTLRIFDLRYRYGTANMVQVSQIQSQVDAAEAAIPPLVQAIGEQENNLNFVLGRNPGPIARGKPIDQLILPTPPAGLPSDLLARRPDVRLSEQQLIAANAQIGAVKAQFFPNISLTGTLGTSATALGTLFGSGTSIWDAGVVVLGPLFKGGEIYGQFIGAKAEQQAIMSQYLKSVEGAFRDTDNALIATTETRKLVTARQQQVGTLKTYANLSSMQFNYGYTDYLTVLNAEDSLFRAQLDLARSQADRALSQVSLYMALGGGWEAADQKTMAANAAIAQGDDPRNPVNQQGFWPFK
jgi:outer membrane protein, multidrug efflux system